MSCCGISWSPFAPHFNGISRYLPTLRNKLLPDHWIGVMIEFHEHPLGTIHRCWFWSSIDCSKIHPLILSAKWQDFRIDFSSLFHLEGVWCGRNSIWRLVAHWDGFATFALPRYTFSLDAYPSDKVGNNHMNCCNAPDRLMKYRQLCTLW